MPSGRNPPERDGESLPLAEVCVVDQAVRIRRSGLHCFTVPWEGLCFVSAKRSVPPVREGGRRPHKPPAENSLIFENQYWWPIKYAATSRRAHLRYCA
jgi:hypothetical protein